MSRPSTPMRIQDIQPSLRRVGKLRLGDKVEYERDDGKTGTRPRKLETWRVTSPSREAVDTVAEAYGGEVTEWVNDGTGGKEWQVTIERDSIDILIIPGDDTFMSAYELWSAGGCQRRCDGYTETLSGEPCMCPPDHEQRSEEAARGKACKATTRVSVILPKVAALGAWWMESHGYYAAKELSSTYDLLDLAGARRGLLPARLRIEQRVSKKHGEKPKHYGVPVLDIGLRFDDLLEIGSGERSALGMVPPPGVDPTTGEITAPAQAALPSAEPAPAAEPVTSTKKAGARKAAATKKQSVIQQGAAMKAKDPMSPQEVAAVRARYDVLDKEHRGLCQQLMNNAGITLREGPPRKSEAASIETILASVEAKQAEAWEDRRKRVFAALEAYGFDDDARHRFIADATSELAAEQGGPTESTKTLTEAQASAVIIAGGGEPEQQTIDEAAS